MSLDVYLECEHCHHAFWRANITHNLGKMAGEGGFYQPVWRPEEVGITRAEQLIEPLERAVAAMEAEPERFRAFDAENGWGLYEHFLPWLRKYLDACRRYPDAAVRASR
jgi:hypothetical protein